MFQVLFDGLQLLSGAPISNLSAEPHTNLGILADIELVVAGEKLPSLVNGEGKLPFNDWCQAMDSLRFELISEEGGRYKLTERWGRFKELTFRRKGDEITITFPGERRKYHCTYQALTAGVDQFKSDVRARLLSLAPRDSVAEWWRWVFLEPLT